MPIPLINVCFRGVKRGHDADMRRCLLLTQSITWSDRQGSDDPDDAHVGDHGRAAGLVASSPGRLCCFDVDEGAGRSLTLAALRRPDRPAMRDLALSHRPA
jgi:hypothetical protein